MQEDMHNLERIVSGMAWIIAALIIAVIALAVWKRSK
jgi:hypothetical protein